MISTKQDDAMLTEVYRVLVHPDSILSEKRSYIRWPVFERRRALILNGEMYLHSEDDDAYTKTEKNAGYLTDIRVARDQYRRHVLEIIGKGKALIAEHCGEDRS